MILILTTLVAVCVTCSYEPEYMSVVSGTLHKRSINNIHDNAGGRSQSGAAQLRLNNIQHHSQPHRCPLVDILTTLFSISLLLDSSDCGRQY